MDRYFHETVSQDVKRRYAACCVLIERSIPLNDVAPELAKKRRAIAVFPLY